MRALVTGGAGFLGSHLCDALIDEGHTVIAVDNLLTGSESNLASQKKEPRFSFEKLDVSEPFDLGPVDYVFHFASPAAPVDYLKYAVETLKVNSMGTMNALELARKYEAKFVLASSSECYGSSLQRPIPESNWGRVNSIGWRSMYIQGKRFAEAAATGYRVYHRVDTKIARIFNTYGPRLRLNDGRALSSFFIQALRGHPITVFGEGQQTRSFCYLSDQIEGLLRLSRSAENDPVNIGNPNQFTILEVAQQVISVTQSTSEITFGPLPLEDPLHRQPDISKARALLDWEPKIALREGLELTVEYFRAVVGASVGSGKSSD